MSPEIQVNIPTPNDILQAETAISTRQFEPMIEHIGSVEQLTPTDIRAVRESDGTEIWNEHEVTPQQRLLESARIDIVGRRNQFQYLYSKDYHLLLQLMKD